MQMEQEKNNEIYYRQFVTTEINEDFVNELYSMISEKNKQKLLDEHGIDSPSDLIDVLYYPDRMQEIVKKIGKKKNNSIMLTNAQLNHIFKSNTFSLGKFCAFVTYENNNLEEEHVIPVRN